MLRVPHATPACPHLLSRLWPACLSFPLPRCPTSLVRWHLCCCAAEVARGRRRAHPRVTPRGPRLARFTAPRGREAAPCPLDGWGAGCDGWLMCGAWGLCVGWRAFEGPRGPRGLPGHARHVRPLSAAARPPLSARFFYLSLVGAAPSLISLIASHLVSPSVSRLFPCAVGGDLSSLPVPVINGRAHLE